MTLLGFRNELELSSHLIQVRLALSRKIMLLGSSIHITSSWEGFSSFGRMNVARKQKSSSSNVSSLVASKWFAG